jgi:hypothetical protein
MNHGKGVVVGGDSTITTLDGERERSFSLLSMDLMHIYRPAVILLRHLQTSHYSISSLNLKEEDIHRANEVLCPSVRETRFLATVCGTYFLLWGRMSGLSSARGRGDFTGDDEGFCFLKGVWVGVVVVEEDDCFDE